MRGKKRPTAEKARAVGIAVMDGASAASRATGVPRPTIVAWMQQPEFDELRQRTKEAVADEWWAGVQHGFRRVIEAFDAEADVQKKATAAAILFDKVAMLRGEATARTENRSLHDELNDHERAALKRVLVDELARRQAGSSDPRPGVDAAPASDSAD